MKSNLLLTIIGLALFLGMSVPSFASSVSLQWDPNTETDLAGYRVYYKADSSELPFDGVEAVEGAAPIDVQNMTTATISGLDPGRTYYLTVTAYNTAGLESPYSKIVAKVPPLPDTTAPDIVSFTIPSTATSRTIPITTFTASDNAAVIGYLITESSATIPVVSAAGWTASPPTSYTFASEGFKMLYAWAKDDSGNISNAIGRAVTVTLPDLTAPAISTFTIPTTSSSLTVPITSFKASDNVGVIGYLITESATAPAVGATGWTAIAPTSFAFSAAGSKTAYAWARDATGNVSASRSSAVTITLPATPPALYTISDALDALRIAVGIIIPTPAQRARTDVMPVDGKTDISDALGILRDVVGIRKVAL